MLDLAWERLQALAKASCTRTAVAAVGLDAAGASLEDPNNDEEQERREGQEQEDWDDDKEKWQNDLNENIEFLCFRWRRINVLEFPSRVADTPIDPSLVAWFDFRGRLVVMLQEDTNLNVHTVLHLLHDEVVGLVVTTIKLNMAGDTVEIEGFYIVLHVGKGLLVRILYFLQRTTPAQQIFQCVGHKTSCVSSITPDQVVRILHGGVGHTRKTIPQITIQLEKKSFLHYGL